MFNIFLTNLGKYNEGYLIGERISLPIGDNELEEVKKRIGINKHYEEMFIADYECDIDGVKVNEFDNVEELNEMAKTLNELNETDKEIIGAIMSMGYSINEAINKKNDVMIFYDCNDMEDVARQYCEEYGILDEIPEDLQYYFDFAAYGRDLELEGTFIFTDNGNCIQVL